MILTCPECATGYFVDVAQIGPEGRKVRCAACGARWHALPEATPAAEAGALAEESGTLAPETVAATDRLGADDLPRVFRTRAEEEKRMRRAAISGAAWAGVGLACVVAIGGAVIFREGVVRAWPQTASIYRAIGLPVNPVGLAIENVHFQPALQQGHAVLVISGEIRNVVDRVVAAPPLRISLLNAQGKRVAGQIDALANAHLPPGDTRHFTTVIVDPPFSAHDLQVEFAMGAGTDAVTMRGSSGAPSDTQPLQLRGPAQPEPSFSNDAVPAAPPPAANDTAAPQ